MLSVHPGVGATPMAWDGFTSPGGGGVAIPRLVNWPEETVYEVINVVPDGCIRGGVEL